MFFEGIRSERNLIETASLNLAHRWYLGDALDEELPDHSSLTHIANTPARSAADLSTLSVAGRRAPPRRRSIGGPRPGSHPTDERNRTARLPGSTASNLSCVE